MSLQKPKTPVICLAYANERTEQGFLRMLTQELKDVMGVLEPAVQRGNCFLKVMPAVTQEEISDVFQDQWYQKRVWIFHYGGHADRERLWLEDEAGGNKEFFALGLAKFLGAQKGLKCVFLNACATKRHAELLLEAGVPAVIATSKKVNDGMATKFAVAFYKGIASGATVEEAYQEAEGLLLGENHASSFTKGEGSRSFYWPEMKQDEAPFPWYLYVQEDNSWFPKNWRLFHELKSAEEESEIKDADFIGEMINNYRIENLLGKGSIGNVFRAVHVNTRQEVAIKISYRILEGYEHLKQIIYVGNKGLTNMVHKNITRVFDVGEIEMLGEKRLYIIMEYVEGERLDKMDHGIEKLDRDGWEEMVSLAVQLSEGLKLAHNTTFEDPAGFTHEGIIHGDLKTRKVLFSASGVPKITDFMFTDFARSNTIKMDLPMEVKQRKQNENLSAYFPPEVISGREKVNKQTDIYALGAIFFEIVTGRLIHEVEIHSEKDMFRELKKRNRLFPNYLVDVFYKALHEDPAKRYQDISEMISDLYEHRPFFGKILYWILRK